MGLEGTYLNIIKATYEKDTTSIILNGQKLQVISLRLRTRQACLFSTYLIEHCTANPCHSNETRRNKRRPNWKEVKLPLFADDMLVYIENLKDFTKKLLEVINESRKVVGYKINIKKSVAFFICN